MLQLNIVNLLEDNVTIRRTSVRVFSTLKGLNISRNVSITLSTEIEKIVSRFMPAFLHTSWERVQDNFHNNGGKCSSLDYDIVAH